MNNINRLSIEEAQKLIRKRKGKIILGEGSSRKVTAIDGYVIKRAKNKRGLMECANEFYIYIINQKIK